MLPNLLRPSSLCFHFQCYIGLVVPWQLRVNKDSLSVAEYFATSRSSIVTKFGWNRPKNLKIWKFYLVQPIIWSIRIQYGRRILDQTESNQTPFSVKTFAEIHCFQKPKKCISLIPTLFF